MSTHTSEMRTIALGGKLNVSICCLGTMTWGEQNTEEEAFQQLDYALNAGVNFIDTAEVNHLWNANQFFPFAEMH